MEFCAEARRRLLPHLAVVFLLWPAASILFAALTLKEQALTSIVPWKAMLLGLSVAAGKMAPEFLAVGLIISLSSIATFSLLRAIRRKSGAPETRFSLLLEPLLLMLALYCGLVLEYPALLRHPLLTPFRSVSVVTVTALAFLFLIAMTAALVQGRSRPLLATLVVVIALVLLGRSLASLPRPAKSRATGGTTVLLGLDSLSQADDVSALRRMTHKLRGTWYEKAVTPGLLTNTVWPAILMHRTVAETGAVFIYQRADWSRSSYNLVGRARTRGCRAVSFFSDQFTTYVGSNGGFDDDRSGPQGWLQVATAGLKNASVFLPVVERAIPKIPGAATPRNQSGTYAFDVAREIRSMLTSGGGSCTLAVGHLDYLHQPAYPAYSELSSGEQAWVRSSPVDSVQDFSLDWQFPVIPGDRLNLYQWKIRRLQTVLEEQVDQTGFLEASRGNRMVVFSDHGNRRGLTPENFGKARYHNVVFATFGVPSRAAAEPVSLLDIPAIIGFPDETRPGPADPVVEYAQVAEGDWISVMNAAHLQPGGEILLDRAVTEKIGARLRGYRPYEASPEYFPTPVER